MEIDVTIGDMEITRTENGHIWLFENGKKRKITQNELFDLIQGYFAEKDD